MKVPTTKNQKQQQRLKTTKLKKTKQHNNSPRKQQKRTFTNNVAPNPAPVKLQSKDVMKLFSSKRTKNGPTSSTLDMDTLETIYNPLDLHTFAPNLAKHYGVISNSRDSNGKAKTSEDYLRRFSHTAGGYTEDDRTLAKYRSNSALFLTHQRTAQHYIASADMQYNIHNQKLLEAQGESPMSNISYQYANQQASSSGSKKRRRQARTMEEEEPLHIKVIRVALAAQDPNWMHQQRELGEYLKCRSPDSVTSSLQQLFAELSMSSKSSRSKSQSNSTKHVAAIPRNNNPDITAPKLTVPGVVEKQIFDNMKNIPLPTASFLDPQQNPDTATTQMYLTTPIDPITEEDPTQTKTSSPQQDNKKADIKTKKPNNQSTIDKLDTATPNVLNTPQQQLQQDITTPEQTSKPRK